MSPNLFLGSSGRIHCLRPSLSLSLPLPPKPITLRCPALASSDAPPASAHFSLDYLIHSCGLSSAEARAASEHIRHLKSPEKPDAVLRYLRDTGMSESVIRAAVAQSPRILCSSVDKNVRPNIEKLRQLGFSVKDIAGIVSRSPRLLQFNIVAKLDFWLGVLGSVESLGVVLRWNRSLLDTNLENVVIPNLSFLLEDCGLSHAQVARLIKSYSRVVMVNPEVMRMNAKRAENLGFDRSSRMFVHALIITSQLNRHTLEARVENLERLGFSPEDVAFMISKTPKLLGCAEDLVRKKLDYLMNVAGCDKMDVVRNPVLLMCSLENRLVPRTVVRNLLRSKGLPVGNKAISSFMQQTEERFVEKFILPYERIVPGLHRAYAEAPTGNSTAEIEYLDSSTSN